MKENDLGVNFILTLVGGFLAVVAGIIALNAKKRRGRKRYNYHMPQQQNFQQQNFQQQNYQQQKAATTVLPRTNSTIPTA